MIALLDDIHSNLHSSTSLPYMPYNMVQCQTNDLHDYLLCKRYAKDMFFVEVVYDAKHNKITEVRCFKEGHLLDKYFPNFNKEY